MSNFQSILKTLRSANGLTQVKLANKLKLSRSTIGMYESGSREPDYDTLELIADFFNVDIDYLLGRPKKTTIIPNHFDNVSNTTTSIPLSSIEKQIILEFCQTDDISKAIVHRALSIDETDFQNKGKNA